MEPASGPTQRRLCGLGALLIRSIADGTVARAGLVTPRFSSGAPAAVMASFDIPPESETKDKVVSASHSNKGALHQTTETPRRCLSISADRPTDQSGKPLPIPNSPRTAHKERRLSNPNGSPSLYGSSVPNTGLPAYSAVLTGCPNFTTITLRICMFRKFTKLLSYMYTSEPTGEHTITLPHTDISLRCLLQSLPCICHASASFSVTLCLFETIVISFLAKQVQLWVT